MANNAEHFVRRILAALPQPQVSRIEGGTALKIAANGKTLRLGAAAQQSQSRGVRFR